MGSRCVIPVDKQSRIVMMNKQTKNSIIYLLGALAGAALGFVNTPLLTRVMTPENYAQYGNLTTFGTLIMSLTFLGLDEAYMRFYNESEYPVGKLIGKCLITPIIIALAFVLILILIEPSRVLSNTVFGVSIHTPELLLCGCYIIVMIIQRIFMLTARIEERAWNYAIAEVAIKASFISVIIIAVGSHLSINLRIVELALITSYVIAILINAFVVLKCWSRYTNTKCIEHDHKYLYKYGYSFAISNSLIYFVPMIERIIMRSTMGMSDLGVYTSSQIFATVINLFSVSLNSVWLPYVYRVDYEGERFKTIFHSVGVCVVWFSAMLLGFTVMTRRWLVMLLGGSYSQAYVIAPAILFGACMTIVMNVYSIGINLKCKTSYHILTPILQGVISVILCRLLIPGLGLSGAGIAIVVSLFISRGLKALLGIHECCTGRTLTRPILILFVCLIISCISSMVFRKVTFDIICGGGLMILSSILCWPEIMFIAKQVIRPDRKRLARSRGSEVR